MAFSFLLKAPPASRMDPVDRRKIHNFIIDPLGRPTRTAGNDHYFYTWRVSVRLSTHIQIAQTKQFQVRIVIATDGIVGLAEGIIDCLLLHVYVKFFKVIKRAGFE